MISDNTSYAAVQQRYYRLKNTMNVLTLLTILSLVGVGFGFVHTFVPLDIPVFEFLLNEDGTSASLVTPQPANGKKELGDATSHSLVNEMEAHKKDLENTEKNLKAKLEEANAPAKAENPEVEALDQARKEAEEENIQALENWEKEVNAELDKAAPKEDKAEEVKGKEDPEAKKVDAKDEKSNEEKPKKEKPSDEVKKEEIGNKVSSGIPGVFAEEERIELDSGMKLSVDAKHPLHSSDHLSKMAKENAENMKNVKSLTLHQRQGERRTGKMDPLPFPDPLPEGTTILENVVDYTQIKGEAPAQINEQIALHVDSPLPNLQEVTSYGKLPKIDATGMTPFQAYRAPKFPGYAIDAAKDKLPTISFLISNIGNVKDLRNSAIFKLPSFVSLCFSPYVNLQNLKQYASDARNQGHEIFLNLPMQMGVFKNYDPGQYGLVSGLSEQENRQRLRRILSIDVPYIGVCLTGNQTFSSSNEEQASILAEEITERGLAIVAGVQIGEENENQIIFEHTIIPDVYITSNVYKSAMRARFEYIKKVAREKGSVLVRIEPIKRAFVEILQFINEETEKGEFAFVPASEYISKQ
ncbi:MAG: divergent polysaccharide deacetylase family protein [Alphaproteobacteria bacterium]|nr:divergent polysaccharide deacetylase family protein [Alphaproteobacteria bacterium]